MSQNQTEKPTRLPGEGLVVTEGDRRVSGTVHQTDAAAQAEAEARKRKLVESGGDPAPVAVKQQLFG